MNRFWSIAGAALLLYVVVYVWRTAAKNTNSLLNPPEGKDHYGLGSGWTN